MPGVLQHPLQRSPGSMEGGLDGKPLSPRKGYFFAHSRSSGGVDWVDLVMG